MPPIPGSIGIAGAAAAGSFLSATKDSVVNTMAAIEAANMMANGRTMSVKVKELSNIPTEKNM